MANLDTIAQSAVSAEALLELGLAVSSEDRPNFVDAHKWFSLAALKGNAEAARFRRDLQQEMTSAQVTAAQRAAREWMTCQ